MLAQLETPPHSPQNPRRTQSPHHNNRQGLPPPQTPQKPKKTVTLQHGSSGTPTTIYFGRRAETPGHEAQRPGQGQDPPRGQLPPVHEEHDDEQDDEDPQGAVGGQHPDDGDDPDQDPEEDDEGYIQGPEQDQRQLLDQGYQSSGQRRQPRLRAQFPGRPRRATQNLGRGLPWWSLSPPHHHPQSAPGSEDPLGRAVGHLLERIEDDLQTLRELFYDLLRQVRGRGPDPERDYIPPNKRTLM